MLLRVVFALKKKKKHTLQMLTQNQSRAFSFLFCHLGIVVFFVVFFFFFLKMEYFLFRTL